MALSLKKGFRQSLTRAKTKFSNPLQTLQFLENYNYVKPDSFECYKEPYIIVPYEGTCLEKLRNCSKIDFIVETILFLLFHVERDSNYKNRIIWNFLLKAAH